MSQSVDRLKQLLFDNEAQALDQLTRRIDGIAEAETRSRDALNLKIDGVAATGTQDRHALAQRIESVADANSKARDEIKRTLDEVYARTGSTERMTASVTEVINEALRRAEVSKHSELTQTIAPLVVTTIKTELRNSQDEMVEALYPITGRLVKAYVASAMKDLSDQMNRRLEQNPVMLRLQSLTTGKSIGELALAGTQNFDVKELYLIRRGSGELVALWPEAEASGRDHAMSGVLAAVNEFANEAFSADQSSLRQIDLGDEEVYLRGSPIYLLAARCSGRAVKSLEQTLDTAFLTAVETQHAIDAQPGQISDVRKAKAAALATLGENLKTEVANQIEELNRPAGMGALKALAAIIALPLIGWWAWSWYTDYRIANIRSVAQRIIEVDPAMLGYPAQIDVGDRGRTLTVSGLTPSEPAKNRILNDITRNLPGIALQDRLNVVAGSGISVPDVSPQFARLRQEMADATGNAAQLSISRTFSRAQSRLRQAELDLVRAISVAADKTQSDALKRHAAEASAVIADAKLLAPAEKSSNGNNGKASGAFQALSARLQALGDELVLTGGGEAHLAAGANAVKPLVSDNKPFDQAIDQFANDAERVAALASTVAFAKSMRPPAPVTIAAPPAPAPQISPRDRLQDWARSHAIFFAANLDYRNGESAKRYIGELAQLMKAAAPSLVRIVGYTDEAGGQARNSALAQDRAFKIRGELIGLGVPVAQITAVGRTGANELSESRGPESPNRRVEFELGFDGEAQP